MSEIADDLHNDNVNNCYVCYPYIYDGPFNMSSWLNN